MNLNAWRYEMIHTDTGFPNCDICPSNKTFAKVAFGVLAATAAFVALRYAAQNADAIKAFGQSTFDQGKAYATQGIDAARSYFNRAVTYAKGGTAGELVSGLPTNKPICTRPPGFFTNIRS
jgi:hypothetical protein